MCSKTQTTIKFTGPSIAGGFHTKNKPNTVKKSTAKQETPLEPCTCGPRWKRRSPEDASIEVIESILLPDDGSDHAVHRPQRLSSGKPRLFYRVLTFKDLAVLHLALTRQFQRTQVDSVAEEYENLLARLEKIMEERPFTIRFD
jgi:hypothetical protein